MIRVMVVLSQKKKTKPDPIDTHTHIQKILLTNIKMVIKHLDF